MLDFTTDLTVKSIVEEMIKELKKEHFDICIHWVGLYLSTKKFIIEQNKSTIDKSSAISKFRQLQAQYQKFNSAKDMESLSSFIREILKDDGFEEILRVEKLEDILSRDNRGIPKT